MHELFDSFTLEMANESYFQEVSEFIEHRGVSHQHLDWSSLRDWLETDYVLIARNHGRICAVIAVRWHLDQNNWVKLFAIDPSYPITRIGPHILSTFLGKLKELNPACVIHSLALWDWYEEILQTSGFHQQDSIITLEKLISPEDGNSATYSRANLPLLLLTKSDTPHIHQIDQMSFSPPWQLTEKELFNAIIKSDYATGFVVNGIVVAYQVSSRNQRNAHINRVAVLPEYQNRKIGSELLADIVGHYHCEKVTTISVNTQESNIASKNLYRRHQFHETGDIIPVYSYSEY